MLDSSSRPSTLRIQQAKLAKKQKTLRLLKRGVWVYFFLLIFEGALRKWVLPGLATPLLIIRDPLALWLLYETRNRLKQNPYVILIIIIGVLSILTAVALGHGSWPVAIFGARIFLIHFPLIFTIGQLFSHEDVIKMGKVTLWITIPMGLLIALQFYSPQTAWVNRGVGGDMAGAGFSGALDYFRPPGTFSFTTGNSQFWSFAACFIFYFWLKSEHTNRLLLVVSTIVLLTAVPLSISRGLFFQIGITAIFATLTLSSKPKYLGKILGATIGIFILYLVLSQMGFFQTAMFALTDRFTTANEQEGGLQGTLVDRFLGNLIASIADTGTIPFWGYGLGLGTNVGAQLLTGGRTFLVAESEWGRLIGELGPLFGLIIIFMRIILSFKLAVTSYQKLRKNDLLPWLLLSFALLMLPIAGWAQPTTLGFSTLISGLLISSLRKSETHIQ